METTWFLDWLAVDVSADERAIKRAYAAKLKQIDPAADPEGFARLREAYERARDWLARVEPDEASDEPLPATGTAASTVPANAMPSQQEGPAEAAERSVRGLAHKLAAGEPADIAAELDASGAALRLHHADAIFHFERSLLAVLASARIMQRPAVFAAASVHFEWKEYLRLKSLGALGAWVESVEQERQAFAAMDISRREDILHWLSNYGDGGDEIPVPAALTWPRLEGALAKFPRYLGLYVSAQRADAWKARYTEVVAAPDWSAESDAERESRFKTMPQPMAPAIRWLGRLVVACALICFVVYAYSL
ncbi:hypothetical protein L2Y96_02980 [Luteibacter aegosomaticola]|uniref:hypothetical protein n=1 Tax=Luteibacter aegosomaticola TaxID=2911538 RepID=UPI001FF8D0A1|nr:hypothetical protein [Luteibacter aegosomaticola]UPG90754.1 hypothetical protein L2Y96_02980 [Luteibacter aegosomaticola]